MSTAIYSMCKCDYITHITRLYSWGDTFTSFSRKIMALYIPELLLALGLIPREGTVVCSKEKLTKFSVLHHLAFFYHCKD